MLDARLPNQALDWRRYEDGGFRNRGISLRSECASLGRSIFEEQDIKEESQAYRAHITKSHVSRYDPATNRCYVEIIMLDLRNADHYSSRSLYDGQTKEMLAFAKWVDGNGMGDVFASMEHGTPIDGSNKAHAYVAEDFINKLMADGHKQ